MRNIMAVLLAAMLPIAPAVAGDSDPASWGNLRQLAPGQSIEVGKDKGESLNGKFVALADESITVRIKQNDVVVPRAEVQRVRLRGKGRRAMWIGLAIGAGAGAALGAAAGARLANESGGDFANLKPAIAAACAGIGALIGLAIGSVAGGRHATVYSTK